jgi:hypothetical protein
MLSMASIITLSPWMPLDRAERLARASVARDGVAEYAAKTADRLQVRQLGRLRGRLAADEGLWVFWRASGDGATYLTVLPAGSGPVGWRGEPKLD